ncbi:hypothetical protein SmJEL517_g01969 [Synchytrium microbalum]|uniref:NADH:ubiquinone oxidoreductase intermediate-associated protein 30 domain-containing protein n=1 Tax=Synchytrium microbalum TaxID=1806994 RepID=A0A507CCL1_9FUNG|nr:uncharacterized protein SmJEL517_g01969 [Synchytrium microbalum]TPX35654.1 hypothetical protein SmJEL517_g01969 [Synchytrium microbalum]
MKGIIAAVSLSLSLFSIVSAQTTTTAPVSTSCAYASGALPTAAAACGASKDLFLDDFNINDASRPTTGESGVTRLPQPPKNITGAVYYNLNGGDYGEGAAPFYVTNGSMTITANSDSSVDGEFASHPGTAPTYNYWFSKYNPCACFDATKYVSLVMEFSADPGLDFNITYTQHASDCLTRTIDSVYYPFSKFIKPTGARQTLILPFSLFTKNLVGGAYDLSHIKDLTFVNMNPMGAKLTVYKMYLSSACGSNLTAASAPNTTSTSTSSNNAPQSLLANSVSLALIAGLVAMFA